MEVITTKQYQSYYCKLLLINNNILLAHRAFLGGLKTMTEFAKVFCDNIMVLDILRDTFSQINSIQIDPDMQIQRRHLRKDLEFVNHLRNKIGGHISLDVIDRCVQWEPYIFHKDVEGKADMQLELICKSMIESAINSYVDENGEQKIFKTEIDICYPPNYKLLLSYLEELNLRSMDYISKVIAIINDEIEYYSGIEQVLQRGFEAGKTDFKINKDRKRH